jgi:putative phosphoesterase
MTLKAGILSDTHLVHPDDQYTRLVNHCFADCSVIIHAGDLTNTSVLDVFGDREVHAVHGNMCDASSYRSLPRETTFAFGPYSVGLTHGAHLGGDIELNLWNFFPEVDCMVYGHTHRAVCHEQGGILIINPGCFRGTGRWGAPGTYAILEAGDTLRATLHEVPPL